jgi:hypothetical protein
MLMGNKRPIQSPISGSAISGIGRSMGVIESLYFAALYRIPYHW